MSVTEPSEAVKSRLNPFAFPSDLDLRFALVVVLILSSSVFLYDGIWLAWPGHREWFLSVAQKCLAIPGGSLTGVDTLTSLDTIPAYSRALNDCERPIREAVAQWIVGGLIVLLVVAGAIYWVLPVWTIRRKRLKRLETDDGTELSAELVTLCREAGLTQSPTFLVEPLNRGISGLAFGRLGGYYVSLSGGLVVTYYRDPAVFRAVVRHELAHLRNRDVDKTYFVVAIWWAFLVAAVVPFLAIGLGGDLGWGLALAWRGAGLVLVVYLTRNAVLRAREVYADLRASVWDGPTGALRRVVEALPSPRAGFWRFLWQLHPSPTERRRLIDDTDGLFRANFWDAVGAGLAMAIAYKGLDMLAFQLLGGLSDVATSWWLTTLAVAPLGVGVVGVGVWRETFADLARSRSVILNGRLGLGLGLGAILGQELAFPATLDALQPNGEPGLAVGIWIAQALWNLGLVLGLVIFVRWLAVGAAVWLRTLDGAPGSRRAMVVGLVLGGYLLTWWYGVVLGAGGVANTALTQTSWPAGIFLAVAIPLAFWVVVLASSPITLLAGVIFWAFPLVAGRWQTQALTPARGWAFLDPPPDSPSWRGEALHLGSALIIGLRGGVVYVGLLLIGRILFRLVVPDELRNQDSVLLAFFWAQVAIAVIASAVAAGVAAGRLRHFGVLNGLAAAFAASATSALAILLLNLVFGGSAAPSFIWMTFSNVVNEGALAALLVTLVSSRRASRGRRPSVGPGSGKIERPATTAA